MSGNQRKTRRKVLKGMSGTSLALVGAGVTSAKKLNQDHEESEKRLIQEESNKPLLKHIIEDHGMHDEITFVTCGIDDNAGVVKRNESTIDLENVNSLQQARNNEAIIRKIPNHLRGDIKRVENSYGLKSTGGTNNISPMSHGGHNTNYSIAKKSALGNIQWKLTLYSTWNWDEEDRVLKTPYGFSFAHTEGSPYNWNGIQDSEITGLATSEGHHRIEGKFTGHILSDKPYVEIGFKVRALSEKVEYRTSGVL